MQRNTSLHLKKMPTPNPRPSLGKTIAKLKMALRYKVPDPLALKLDKALSSSSFASLMVPRGLFMNYFVRVDKWGFYHLYPDCDGPFESLDEAQKAINAHHLAQRKIMCMDGLSHEERAVRNALYWFHDGTRRHSKEALASCTRSRPEEMLKALLDRYNEDNNLLGDYAYELKEIVTHKTCFDGKDCIYRSYSHFNLTMKNKGASESDLYFAEVTCLSDAYELYVLTCICLLKADDNGECFVCEVECQDMKHTTNNDDDDGAYILGRPPRFPLRSGRSGRCGAALFEKLYAVRDDDWLAAEEARVRAMIREGIEARGKTDMIQKGTEARGKTDMIHEGTKARGKIDKIQEGTEARSKRIEEGTEARSKTDRIQEGTEARGKTNRIQEETEARDKREKYVVPARRK